MTSVQLIETKERSSNIFNECVNRYHSPQLCMKLVGLNTKMQILNSMKSSKFKTLLKRLGVGAGLTVGGALAVDKSTSYDPMVKSVISRYVDPDTKSTNSGDTEAMLKYGAGSILNTVGLHPENPGMHSAISKLLAPNKMSDNPISPEATKEIQDHFKNLGYNIDVNKELSNITDNFNKHLTNLHLNKASILGQNVVVPTIDSFKHAIGLEHSNLPQ